MILFIIIFLSIIYVIINFNNIKEYFDIAPSDGYFTLYNKSLMAELNKDNNNNGDKYNLDIIKKMDPDIFNIDFEKSNTQLQSKLKLLEQETDQKKIDKLKKDIRIIVNTYHNTQPKYASADPYVRIRSSKGGLKRLPDIGTYDCAGAAGKQHIGGDKCKAGDTDKQCLTKCTKACDDATDPECLGIRFKRSEGQANPSCYLTKGIPTERKSLHALLPKDVDPEWCSSEQNKKQEKNRLTFYEKCRDVNSQTYKNCAETCDRNIYLTDIPQCKIFSGYSIADLYILCSPVFNERIEKYNKTHVSTIHDIVKKDLNKIAKKSNTVDEVSVVLPGIPIYGIFLSAIETVFNDDNVNSSIQKIPQKIQPNLNNLNKYLIGLKSDNKTAPVKPDRYPKKCKKGLIYNIFKKWHDDGGAGSLKYDQQDCLNGPYKEPCTQSCQDISEKNINKLLYEWITKFSTYPVTFVNLVKIPKFNESCKNICRAKNMPLDVRTPTILSNLNMTEMWNKVLPDNPNASLRDKSDYCRAKHKEYCDPNLKNCKVELDMCQMNICSDLCSNDTSCSVGTYHKITNGDASCRLSEYKVPKGDVTMTTRCKDSDKIYAADKTDLGYIYYPKVKQGANVIPCFNESKIKVNNPLLAKVSPADQSEGTKIINMVESAIKKKIEGKPDKASQGKKIPLSIPTQCNYTKDLGPHCYQISNYNFGTCQKSNSFYGATISATNN
jgi:hypothetical protein